MKNTKENFWVKQEPVFYPPRKEKTESIFKPTIEQYENEVEKVSTCCGVSLLDGLHQGLEPKVRGRYFRPNLSPCLSHLIQNDFELKMATRGDAYSKNLRRTPVRTL